MGAPDEFHPDVHPDATEITGDRRYGEWGQCVVDPASSTGERCRGYAKGPHGKCYNHGGSTPDGDENPKQGRGDQDGNNNAATHGSYSEDFLDEFLTDEEKQRVRKGFHESQTPEGAQDIARTIAFLALEQFRRTGDERFLRRAESIMDKAGIFPADELDLNTPGLEEAFMDDLRSAHGEGDD